MIAQLFFIFQVFLLFLLSNAFSKKNELLWAFSSVLAGILAFIAKTSIEFSEGSNIMLVTDNTAFSINLGLMMFSLTWMFLDTYQNYGSPFLLWSRLKKEGGYGTSVKAKRKRA